MIFFGGFDQNGLVFSSIVNIQGVPKKRSLFWKRLIIIFLMINSSNFEELSLTIPDFVT